MLRPPRKRRADSMDFLPFGEQIAGDTGTTHKFTGYERDSESNLDNAQARYYGSPLGRFMSPDPAGNAVADPTNPQTWNMYPYVTNNPLTMIDPTGLDGEGGGSECDPNNASCVPYCGFDCVGGIGPPTQLPNQLTVNVFYGTITPTTGLPSGILATGPGFDYSWLGLLTWAGILSPPCSPLPGIGSPCFQDAGNITPANDCAFWDYECQTQSQSESQAQPETPAMQQSAVTKLAVGVIHFFCGGSARDEMISSMRDDATGGAIVGAGGGFIGGEAFFGVGGFPGAVLGGYLGGVLGGARGIVDGFETVTVCSVLGVY